jgi:hypothetical protein
MDVLEDTGSILWPAVRCFREHHILGTDAMGTWIGWSFHDRASPAHHSTVELGAPTDING